MSITVTQKRVPQMMKFIFCSAVAKPWGARTLSSFLSESSSWTRDPNSHCEFAELRKIAKAKRIRFASLRRKRSVVRFAFASHFEHSNSQNCEKIRRILAKSYPKFSQKRWIFNHFASLSSHFFVFKHQIIDLQYQFWELFQRSWAELLNQVPG